MINLNFPLASTKVPVVTFKEYIKPALAGIARWIQCELQTKGLPVQFPVRAHAWVAGQVPSRGPRVRQAHIDVSLSLFLPPFPSL